MLLKIFCAAVILTFVVGFDVRQPATMTRQPVKAVADEPAAVLCIDNTAAGRVLR